MTPNAGANHRHRAIHAAGGVVWRQESPTPVVAVVHRPRYDDWSLPKGKLKHGEHLLAAAVREVAEETGVRATPQFPLPQVRYWLGERAKLVDYWAMAAPPAGIGEFQPNSEVDGLAWLPVTEAIDRLSYRHDADLLRGWASLPPVTGTVLLIRHAEAGEHWPERDAQRPLSSGGVADAAALCRLLALFAPVRLISASPLRCRQTLQPLASTGELPIEVDPVFDDMDGGEADGDPAAASARLHRLAETGATTVVCSQRVIVPAVLARIAGDTGQWRTAKGDGWVLSNASAGWLPPAPLHAKRVRQ